MFAIGAAATIPAQVNCAGAQPGWANPELGYPKVCRLGPSPPRRTDYIDRAHEESGFAVAKRNDPDG